MKNCCFTSRQIKATLRSHLVPVRMSAVKTRTANTGSGRQKGLVAKGGNIIHGLVTGSQCGELLRTGTRHHLEYTPTDSQAASHRLHTNVCGSTTHKS